MTRHTKVYTGSMMHKMKELLGNTGWQAHAHLKHLG